MSSLRTCSTINRIPNPTTLIHPRRITPSIRCQSSHNSTSQQLQPPADLIQRRNLLLAGLATATTLASTPLPAFAEDAAAPSSSAATKLFYEVSLNSEPIGRIVIQTYTDVPIGSTRLVQLTQGLDGVSFRRTKIEYISPDNGFFQSTTKKELTKKASGYVRLAGGADGEALEGELAAKKHKHDRAVVSLQVTSNEERVTKEKLVAIKGQFVTVTEAFGELPNGSAITFTCKPQPELDDTHLVVGEIIEGLDVVEKVAALPRVKDNSGSPFFKAGKAAGDKRADVAERAFGKPYGKLTINECGVV